MSILNVIGVFSTLLLNSVLLGGVNGDDHRRCLSSEKAGLGNTGGWTFPQEDITIEAGSALEIYCSLDLDNPLIKGYSAENIMFSNSFHHFDTSYVQVVNKTTAKLYIKNIGVMDDTFYCTLPVARKMIKENMKKMIVMLKDPVEQLICSNRVLSGNKPEKIKDLHCMSYNWETLTCRWNVPSNGIETDYKVSYQIPQGVSKEHWFPCPNQEPGKCVWSLHTVPPYIPSYEYLRFLVVGTNIFGNSTEEFEIHHHEFMEPASPKGLEAISETSSSVCLQFSIGMLKNFEKGLIYKVRFGKNQSRSQDYAMFNAKNIVKEGELVKINVTGLKHPNTQYFFAVFMKSSLTPADFYWSKPATVVAKTKPSLPDRSPETDLGSYEITGQDGKAVRDVVIYWKPIPDEEHNSDHFWYDVSILEGERESQEKPVLITESFAKFTGLSYYSYTFLIKAANTEGHAPHSSTIRIPFTINPRDAPLPTVFTKFHLQGDVYELSWDFEDSKCPLCTSCSIYWAEGEGEQLRLVKWIHMGSECFETPRYNVTDPDSKYKFAISVYTNLVERTGGMKWATVATTRGNVKNISTKIFKTETETETETVEWASPRIPSDLEIVLMTVLLVTLIVTIVLTIMRCVSICKRIRNCSNDATNRGNFRVVDPVGGDAGRNSTHLKNAGNIVKKQSSCGEMRNEQIATNTNASKSEHEILINVENSNTIAKASTSAEGFQMAKMAVKELAHKVAEKKEENGFVDIGYSKV